MLRRPAFLLAALGAAAWILAAGAGSAAATEPVLAGPLGPRPAGPRLLGDAADGRLDEFSLWQAALVAGGSESAERQQAAARFQGLQAELQAILKAERRSAAGDRRPSVRRGRWIQPTSRAPQAPERAAPMISPPVPATPTAIAERIFRFMHRRVLTGDYQTGQNDLARTLRTGDYNCVTATILFNCLCRNSGLKSQAIAAPAHVFSRVIADTRLDVETTCARWFESPDRQRPARPGRRLSDVQLIAKIFYNRGVQLLQEDEFARALSLFETSIALDADDQTARTNRLATLNNWALAESNAGRFEQAVRLLQRGAALDSRYVPIQANDLHVHQRWAQSLCEQKRYREAFALLEARRRERPSPPLYQNGPEIVYQQWLSDALQWETCVVQATDLLTARQRLGPRPTLDRWEQAAVRGAAERRRKQGKTASAQRLEGWYRTHLHPANRRAREKAPTARGA